MQDLQQAVETLQTAVGDPSRGLPEEVFRLVTRLTPMINVDLLIRDAQGRCLLTWRVDEISVGWHVPGGIIRFRETAAERIVAVARCELGAEVTFDARPLTIREIIHPVRLYRGHFISLLYGCELQTEPDPARKYLAGTPAAGQWAYHRHCPENIVEVHREYAQYFPRADGREPR